MRLWPKSDLGPCWGTLEGGDIGKWAIWRRERRGFADWPSNEVKKGRPTPKCPKPWVARQNNLHNNLGHPEGKLGKGKVPTGSRSNGRAETAATQWGSGAKEIGDKTRDNGQVATCAGEGGHFSILLEPRQGL